MTLATLPAYFQRPARARLQGSSRFRKLGLAVHPAQSSHYVTAFYVDVYSRTIAWVNFGLFNCRV